ncbi:hypothetical protein B5M09_010392, partial [Aphanomyces astaci]
MSGESPTNKEKERISKPAHAACTQVLAMLLGHETLQSPSLSTAARSALLDGTYANIDAVEPADLKAKLTRKTMGLDVVQKLLGSKPSRCRFKTCERFSKDVRLVFQNILLYQSYLKDHAPKVYDPTLFETSQRLLQGFEMMYAGELARHVTTLAAQPSPSVSPEPSPAAPSSHKPPSTTLSHRPSSSSSLSDDDKVKCHGIVQRIMKYKEMGVAMAAPFFNPVDVGMYVDYKVKIPHRMHLYGVQQKLSTGAYASAAAFVQDMRLIFANCLVYNSEVILSAKIREHAVKLMHVLEQLVEQASFDQTPNATATSTSSSSSSSSRREFADKDKCLQMLETLRQHKMRGAMGKDIHTAYPFLHAVDITRYPDYAKIVSEPMDFNKIDVRKRKLKSNRYTSLSEFSADVHLIFSNCLKYNSDPVEGADIRTMATTLRDCFIQLYQNL